MRLRSLSRSAPLFLPAGRPRSSSGTRTNMPSRARASVVALSSTTTRTLTLYRSPPWILWALVHGPKLSVTATSLRQGSRMASAMLVMPGCVTMLAIGWRCFNGQRFPTCSRPRRDRIKDPPEHIAPNDRENIEPKGKAAGTPQCCRIPVDQYLQDHSNAKTQHRVTDDFESRMEPGLAHAHRGEGLKEAARAQPTGKHRG